MSIQERLQQCAKEQFARRPPDEQERIRTFFRENPNSKGAFMFFDGRFIDCDVYHRRMTSRTAQLVAIATDGFPVPVSVWEIL